MLDGRSRRHAAADRPPPGLVCDSCNKGDALQAPAEPWAPLTNRLMLVMASGALTPGQRYSV